MFGRAAASLASKFSLTREFVFSKLLVTLSPLLLLWLDFIQEKYVLRDISLTLLLLAAAGTAYLQITFHNELIRSRRQTQEHPEPAGQGEPAGRRRAFWAVLLASFSIYSFILLSGLMPSLPFTGDEPHYLLTAKSLVRDHDIDVGNNYLNKDYWEFYPGELSLHAYPGRKGPEHLYSKHFPALSLLLAPAYWCGDRLGKTLKIPGINMPNERNIRVLLARETMVLLTSLLAAFFFLMVWEFTQNRSAAVWAWIFFAFTPPLLFYSRLLYSEIPVALAILLVFRRTFSQKPHTGRSLFWSGMGIAILPWFGIKYSVIAASILAVLIWAQWRLLREQPLKRLPLFAPLLFSGALFLAFIWGIYGTFSPFAVYLGSAAVNSASFRFQLPFGRVSFSVRALAYFLDQRMGLFIHSPLYLLTVPGAILSVKRWRKQGLAALFVVVPFWLFCAGAQAYGGHAPPERILLPVGFILALFAAAVLPGNHRKSPVSPLVKALLVVAVFMSFLAIVRPDLYYHRGLSEGSWDGDTRSQLLIFMSNAMVDLSSLVPNLAFRPAFSWPVLLSWLALIVVITLAVLKKMGRPIPSGPGRRASVVLLLSLLLAMHQFFSVRLDAHRQMAVAGGMVFFQDENAFPPEPPGGFWIKGDCRSEVVLKTTTPLKELRLELTSLGPVRATARIGSHLAGDRLPAQTPNATDVTLPKPRGTPWRGHHLYLVGLEVVGGFVPQEIEASSPDRRRLGIFVRFLPVLQ